MELELRVEQLTKETVELRREILIMKALVRKQNSMIKDLTQMNGADVLPFSKSSPHAAHLRFPIMTQENFDEFEASVNSTNRHETIAEMKLLIGGMSLRKCLSRIISDDLILNYTVDGRPPKKSLQNYINFLTSLHEATGLYHDKFITDLRQAIRNVKNRMYKANHLERKKQITEKKNANKNESDDERDDDDDDEDFDEIEYCDDDESYDPLN